MIEIGYTNRMKIVRFTPNGAYLDGEDLGEVLLPKRFLTPEMKEGAEISAFLYFDSEDRLTATIQHPYTEINRFAYLECVAVTSMGAFLSWGLDKDLLVPKSEQKDKFVKGKKYFVYVYLDEVSQRIVASNRINRFLQPGDPEYNEGDKCEIFIAQPADLGYKVIVDNAHWGMVYFSELFREVKPGDYTYGFVKKVRDDMRIDIMLEKNSAKLVDKTEQEIYARIKECGGFLPFSDKSSPEEIQKEFQVSKKVFKKAVGGLYKSKLIEITNNGLKIV
ncbi:MAG: GntR family transcriptional regulator [Bacteroidales bacterium]|nr:GntR family transcriptional regulator [Bacteroidales bacterium]MCR4560418.1 GntR family transcriptional regulator [Bacteroidales bacterium]